MVRCIIYLKEAVNSVRHVKGQACVHHIDIFRESSQNPANGRYIEKGEGGTQHTLQQVNMQRHRGIPTR